jgi:hypothetical protein
MPFASSYKESNFSVGIEGSNHPGMVLIALLGTPFSPGTTKTCCKSFPPNPQFLPPKAYGL